jgi:DNA repair protein SbcC/Rad50
LPDIADDVLAVAKQSLATARAARESADRAVHSSEKDVAIATQTLATSQETTARCRAELATKEEELAAYETRLAPLFASSVPNDADEILATRASEVKAIAARAEAAAKMHTDAVTRLSEKTRAVEAGRGRTGEIAAALGAVSVTPALNRVTKAAPKMELPEPWPEVPPDDPARLVESARALATALSKLSAKLDGAAGKAEASRSKLLEQALAALPGELEMDVEDLNELAEAVAELSRRASEDAALAKRGAADLKDRLVAATAMRGEVATDREEHHVYKALGLELKDDRIVEYLQEEALQVLAMAASARLQDLSSGRYRLLFDDGEFLVVDAWNGDEQRSVSTLSGGETFLASLALALALSEQIQLLAVNERNKLESLFLDEGFGTLDSETLEVVVNAIEQLGGEERLVGVITHVPDLAERLPVRLEVTKSPRGSVVSKSVGELTRVAV